VRIREIGGWRLSIDAYTTGPAQDFTLKKTKSGVPIPITAETTEVFTVYMELELRAGSRVTGNSSTGQGGGGVSVVNGGPLAMIGGEVSGNSATDVIYSAGGVYVSSSPYSGSGPASFTMSGGAVSHNTSGTAGGVFVDYYNTFTKQGGDHLWVGRRYLEEHRPIRQLRPRGLRLPFLYQRQYTHYHGGSLREPQHRRSRGWLGVKTRPAFDEARRGRWPGNGFGALPSLLSGGDMLPVKQPRQ
jgi:hypothetical protein